MNFSKKLFTGFTATAVGISLMAGGFSVLGEEKPKQGEEIKQANVVNPGAADTDTEKVQETVPEAKKEEYKTVEEATAAKEKLEKNDLYQKYVKAQSEMVKAIDFDNLVKRVKKLVGHTLVNKNDKRERVIQDSDIESLKPQIRALISGEKTAKDFEDYKNKLKNWNPKGSKDVEEFNLLVKLAEAIEEKVIARDEAKDKAKDIISQIKAIDEKIAELKKANENSNSKKQETKAKETNKNQKSSNGTNNATATKKADATKIKTGVE